MNNNNQTFHELEKVIRLKSEDPIGYINRGSYYFWRVEYEKAIADYSKAINLNPENTEIYMIRVETYHIIGDFDKAIADCDEVIRLDPGYVSAYRWRGSAYERKEEYDKAIADYTEAIRLDPECPLAYTDRARTYERKEEYDKAIVDYSELIRLDPDDSEAYHDRGKVYEEKGEYDKAIADHSEAIRLDLPEEASSYRSREDASEEVLWEEMKVFVASSYRSRGDVYYQKGEYNKAIADYDEAIRLDCPDEVHTYRSRGDAYYQKGEYDKAIVDYDEAIRLDFRCYSGHSRYRRPSIGYVYDVYERTRDYDSAIKGYDEVIKLNTYHVMAVYLNRGSLHLEMGNHSAAIEDFDNAVRICSNYETDLNDCEFVFRGKGVVEQAIQLLESIINNFSESDADYYYYTGVQSLFRNDVRSAEKAFQRALKLGYENRPKIGQHLENLKNRK